MKYSADETILRIGDFTITLTEYLPSINCRIYTIHKANELYDCIFEEKGNFKFVSNFNRDSVVLRLLVETIKSNS